MAITTLFLTGFEHGFVAPAANAGHTATPTPANGLFEQISAAGVSVRTTGMRNGARCARLAPAANTVCGIQQNIGLPTKMVTRFAVKVITRPTSGVCTIFHGISPTAYAILCSSTGQLQAKCGGSGVVVNGPTIDTTSWHVIEVQFDSDGDTLDWKVDGVLQTRATGVASIPQYVRLGTGEATQPAFVADFDDWIIGTWTDAAADWYGDGKILAQLPGLEAADALGTASTFSAGDAGAFYTASPTTAYTMVDDPPGTGGWTATRSTTDNLALRAATAGAVLFMGPTPTSEAGQANAVRAIMSYSSAGTQANLAACDVSNSLGSAGRVELWGLVGGVGKDYSEATNYFKAAFVPRPAAGWTAAEVNAVRVRFGAPTSADVSPVPTLQAWMLEVDWPVAALPTGADPATVSDTFDDNTLDPAKWEELLNPGFILEQNQRLELPHHVATQLGLKTMIDASLGPVFCKAGLNMVDSGNSFRVGVYDWDDPGENFVYVTWDCTGADTGDLIINGYQVGGPITLPYDPAAHAWVRIRWDAPTTNWIVETSPDGDTWTVRVNAGTGKAPTRARFRIDSYSGAAAGPKSWIDNFNYLGPRTLYGASSMAITVGKAVAATRKTFGATTQATTFGAVTAGRVTFTRFGAVAMPIGFAAVTQGRRKTLAAVSMPITVARAVSGSRRTFGVLSAPFGFTAGIAGRRKTFSSAVAPTTFGATTAGFGFKPTVTHYGASSLQANFASATQGQRKTFGTVARASSFGAVTAASRKTFGVVARPVGFGAVTAGNRVANTFFGAVAATYAFARTVQGQRRAFGAITAPTVFAATTQARRRTTSSIAMPASFGAVVQGRRKTFGTLLLPIGFGAALGPPRIKTYGVVARPLVFGIATSGFRPTGDAIGSLAAVYTFGRVTQGRRKTFGVVARPLTFGEITQGRRRTTSSTAMPITLARVVAGRRKTFGVVGRPLTFGAFVAGDIPALGPQTYYGRLALPAVLSLLVAGRRRTFSSTSAPFVFTETTSARRRTFGSVAMPLSFDVVSRARLTALGRVSAVWEFDVVVAGDIRGKITLLLRVADRPLSAVELYERALMAAMLIDTNLTDVAVQARPYRKTRLGDQALSKLRSGP